MCRNNDNFWTVGKKYKSLFLKERAYNVNKPQQLGFIKLIKNPFSFSKAALTNIRLSRYEF